MCASVIQNKDNFVLDHANVDFGVADDEQKKI